MGLQLLYGRPVLGVVVKTALDEILALRADVEGIVDPHLHDVALKIGLALG